MINQDLWEKMPNGYITIKFYANDILGHIKFDEVVIVKDTPTPSSSPGGIPGYNLFVLLGVLSVVIIIITRKLRNLRG